MRALRHPAVLRRLAQRHRIRPRQGADRRQKNGGVVRLQTFQKQTLLRRQPQPVVKRGPGTRREMSIIASSQRSGWAVSQTSRKNSRIGLFTALATRSSASMEMIFSPRSTSPMYFGFNSANSPSFSWVKCVFMRSRRIASPMIRRCFNTGFRFFFGSDTEPGRIVTRVWHHHFLPIKCLNTPRFFPRKIGRRSLLIGIQICRFTRLEMAGMWSMTVR